MFFSIIVAAGAMVGAVVILQEIAVARGLLASKMDRNDLMSESDTIRRAIKKTEGHISTLEMELRKQTMTRTQMEAKLKILEQKIRAKA